MIQYLPGTFEGMMEAFGKNLQRKTLYEEFYQDNKELADLSNKKDTQLEIIKKVRQMNTTMVNIMKASSVDPCTLKNEHNEVFLSLMERLEYLKNQDADRQRVIQMKK